jgi:acyl-CoA dehydrogenase
MNFEYNDTTRQHLDRLFAFMDEYVYPIEKKVHDLSHQDPMSMPDFLEPLKQKAKGKGMWNWFLPREYGDISPGLSNLEYAPLAEEMGKIGWSSGLFNCSAPDTGNMEVLAKFGSPAQQKRWLDPLLEGEIRSAFLMTEPQVASSDATNIETSIVRDGDGYVINGRKWWSSNIFHPHCELLIVMGKTDTKAPRHAQQSMILVPRNTPGVEIVRPLPVFHALHYPGGHGEVKLTDVRVPAENLILGEGRGFEIAQGRLGPGRIHHCMRLVGQADRALDYMCRRVSERETFGKTLRDYSSIRQEIARSRCEIEQARLLVLKTADTIDKKGAKGARDLISMIKIVVPAMTAQVVDRAIQSFGGKGVTNDTPLAEYYISARYLRIGDGPDEVHMYQLGRNTVKERVARERQHVPYFDEIE